MPDIFDGIFVIILTAIHVLSPVVIATILNHELNNGPFFFAFETDENARANLIPVGEDDINNNN